MIAYMLFESSEQIRLKLPKHREVTVVALNVISIATYSSCTIDTLHYRLLIEYSFLVLLAYISQLLTLLHGKFVLTSF